MSINLYQIAKKFKTSLIKQLRQGFSEDLKYTFVALDNGATDRSRSKIMISDSVPEGVISIPAIIINTQTTDEIRFLDNDFVFFDDNNEIVSTFITIEATLTVLTRDSVARDEILDTSYNILRTFNKIDQLNQDGIYITSIRFTPETRTQVGARIWHTPGITISAIAEWIESPEVAVPINDVTVDREGEDFTVILT